MKENGIEGMVFFISSFRMMWWSVMFQAMLIIFLNLLLIFHEGWESESKRFSWVQTLQIAECHL